MIFYLSIIFIFCFGYYTISYAVFLLTQKDEKLASFGTILIAIIGTIVPIIGLVIAK